VTRALPALLAAAVLALAPAAQAAQTFEDALGAVRGQAGLGPVRADPALTAAAQAHAEDMARSGYFSHTGQDGSDVRVRAERTGCRGGWMAENLAWGFDDVSAVLAGWMASPGHRTNMLGPNYRVYGLGESGGIWVLMVSDRC
jgi:uncharacterized protein YkwD